MANTALQSWLFNTGLDGMAVRTIQPDDHEPLSQKLYAVSYVMDEAHLSTQLRPSRLVEYTSFQNLMLVQITGKESVIVHKLTQLQPNGLATALSAKHVGTVKKVMLKAQRKRKGAPPAPAPVGPSPIPVPVQGPAAPPVAAPIPGAVAAAVPAPVPHPQPHQKVKKSRVSAQPVLLMRRRSSSRTTTGTAYQKSTSANPQSQVTS